MLDKLRVLVVDDQDSMRQLVMSALRSIGVQHMAQAENGQRALELLKPARTDLVLLDVEMPVMGGEETLKAIRGTPELADLKVIMMTGRADADFVRRMAQVGLDGYLVKPVSAAALQTRIAAAFPAKV
jgi:two-component system chemotaxis response regulator CheY